MLQKEQVLVSLCSVAILSKSSLTPLPLCYLYRRAPLVRYKMTSSTFYAALLVAITYFLDTWPTLLIDPRSSLL